MMIANVVANLLNKKYFYAAESENSVAMSSESVRRPHVQHNIKIAFLREDCIHFCTTFLAMYPINRVPAKIAFPS